jgi:hypothetical protein
MSSDVIVVGQWRKRNRVCPKTLWRALREVRMARSFRWSGPVTAPRARRAEAACEHVRVRSALKLWPKPGMFC